MPGGVSREPTATKPRPLRDERAKMGCGVAIRDPSDDDRCIVRSGAGDLAYCAIGPAEECCAAGRVIRNIPCVDERDRAGGESGRAHCSRRLEVAVHSARLIGRCRCCARSHGCEAAALANHFGGNKPEAWVVGEVIVCVHGPLEPWDPGRAVSLQPWRRYCRAPVLVRPSCPGAGTESEPSVDGARAWMRSPDGHGGSRASLEQAPQGGRTATGDVAPPQPGYADHDDRATVALGGHRLR